MLKGQYLTKKIILLTFLFWKVIFPNNLLGQNYCNSDRFIDNNFFHHNKISIDTNITYGVAIDWLGFPDTQKFHIVYPKQTVDSLKYRPFVLLIHGGGFHTEDDFSNKNQWNKLCIMLAQRGFVAATIDYRVGWKDPDEEWTLMEIRHRPPPSPAAS